MSEHSERMLRQERAKFLKKRGNILLKTTLPKEPKAAEDMQRLLGIHLDQIPNNPDFTKFAINQRERNRQAKACTK